MQLLTDTSRKRPLPVTESKVHNLSIPKWIRYPISENQLIPKIIEIQFSCKIMHAFLTRLVRIRWLNIAQGLFWVFMGRDEAEVNKNAKKTRATVSHLDQTSLVSQRKILSNLTRTFSCVTNAGNPEQARCVHLSLLGSQSDHIISSCPLADSAIYIHIIRTQSLSSVHAPAGKFDCISLCVFNLLNEYLLNNNNASLVHDTITAINFKFVFRLCVNVYD